MLSCLDFRRGVKINNYCGNGKEKFKGIFLVNYRLGKSEFVQRRAVCAV